MDNSIYELDAFMNWTVKVNSTFMLCRAIIPHSRTLRPGIYISVNEVEYRTGHTRTS